MCIEKIIILEEIKVNGCASNIELYCANNYYTNFKNTLLYKQYCSYSIANRIPVFLSCDITSVLFFSTPPLIPIT